MDSPKGGVGKGGAIFTVKLKVKMATIPLFIHPFAGSIIKR